MSKDGSNLKKFKSSAGVSAGTARDYVKKARKQQDAFSRPVVYEGEKADFKYFPSQYGDEKLKDKLTEFHKRNLGLKQLAEADKTVASNITAPLPEDDINTLVDLQKMQELIQFDKQFEKLFDLSDFASMQRALRIYPEYFDNKLQFIHSVARLQEKLAMITIDGIKNGDDMNFVISTRIGPRRSTDMWSIVNLAPHKLLEMKGDEGPGLSTYFPGYVKWPFTSFVPGDDYNPEDVAALDGGAQYKAIMGGGDEAARGFSFTTKADVNAKSPGRWLNAYNRDPLVMLKK